MSRDEIFKQVVQRIREKNPAFSTRALAKKLGCSQALISQVLSGKKPLSTKLALSVIQNMEVSEEESAALLSIKRRAPRAGRTGPKRGQYQSPEFVEKEGCNLSWLDCALLDLTTLRNFQPDIQWMAQELGTTPARVVESVEGLTRAGYLRVDGKGIRKISKKLYFSAARNMSAVRQYHRESIQRALAELTKSDQADIDRRFFQGLTLAVDGRALPEAKRRLKNFLQEMCDLMATDESSELYQLNLHLFPIGSKKLKS